MQPFKTDMPTAPRQSFTMKAGQPATSFPQYFTRFQSANTKLSSPVEDIQVAKPPSKRACDCAMDCNCSSQGTSLGGAQSADALKDLRSVWLSKRQANTTSNSNLAGDDVNTAPAPMGNGQVITAEEVNKSSRTALQSTSGLTTKLAFAPPTTPDPASPTGPVQQPPSSGAQPPGAQAAAAGLPTGVFGGGGGAAPPPAAGAAPPPGAQTGAPMEPQTPPMPAPEERPPSPLPPGKYLDTLEPDTHNHPVNVLLSEIDKEEQRKNPEDHEEVEDDAGDDMEDKRILSKGKGMKLSTGILDEIGLGVGKTADDALMSLRLVWRKQSFDDNALESARSQLVSQQSADNMSRTNLGDGLGGIAGAGAGAATGMAYGREYGTGIRNAVAGIRNAGAPAPVRMVKSVLQGFKPANVKLHGKVGAGIGALLGLLGGSSFGRSAASLSHHKIPTAVQSPLTPQNRGAVLDYLSRNNKQPVSSVPT